MQRIWKPGITTVFALVLLLALSIPLRGGPAHCNDCAELPLEPNEVCSASFLKHWAVAETPYGGSFNLYHIEKLCGGCLTSHSSCPTATLEAFTAAQLALQGRMDIGDALRTHGRHLAVSDGGRAVILKDCEDATVGRFVLDPDLVILAD